MSAIRSYGDNVLFLRGLTIDNVSKLFKSNGSTIGKRLHVLRQILNISSHSEEALSLDGSKESLSCQYFLDRTVRFNELRVRKKEEPKRLDLSHRLPLSFPDYDNLREIESEFALLSMYGQQDAQKIKLFLITYRKNLLNADQLKLVAYLEGRLSLDDIGLNRSNAARFMKIVKIFDLAAKWQTRLSRSCLQFPHSTFEIRKRILELLSPEMETVEAYTYSLDASKRRNVDYLRNPMNWVPERLRFYAAMIIPQEFIKMISLSRRLNDAPPRVYALRGGTASGKTTVIRQRFVKALDDVGELSGCTNPDNFKCTLKTFQHLTNLQVHEEVVRGPLSSYKRAVLLLPRYSIILDTRLSSVEDFEEGVINAAKVREGHATVVDLDVPLKLSMRRVLDERNPWGKSPCVNAVGIRNGFQEIRHCRHGVVERIKREELVDHYELLSAQASGEWKLVAEKRGHQFKVISEASFQSCLTIPTDGDITQEMDRQLDVTPWKGFSVQQALDCHARGMSPSCSFAPDKP